MLLSIKFLLFLFVVKRSRQTVDLEDSKLELPVVYDFEAASLKHEQAETEAPRESQSHREG